MVAAEGGLPGPRLGVGDAAAAAARVAAEGGRPGPRLTAVGVAVGEAAAAAMEAADGLPGFRFVATVDGVISWVCPRAAGLHFGHCHSSASASGMVVWATSRHEKFHSKKFLQGLFRIFFPFPFTRLRNT